MDYYPLISPLVHLLPPEFAHRAAIRALATGMLPPAPAESTPSLQTELFGLAFANPVGIAAGFDKDAEAVDALLGQGFGFVEAGTVTPRPQAGNPSPRLFRLKEDKAVINRFGFNSGGLEPFVARIAQRKKGRGVVGVNIGKNKDSADAIQDYTACLRAVYVHADYITINISSPNTVGLRALQERAPLEALIDALMNERAQLRRRTGKSVAMLVKIAPDLTDQDKEDIADIALSRALDGLIVSNTTIARPDTLQSEHKHEAGGLSGAPLFAPSTAMLADIYKLTQGKIPLIGVGGIASAEDAYAKIRAGASLVQLYSALVYQGFGLVQRINHGVAALLARDGFATVKDAVGKS